MAETLPIGEYLVRKELISPRALAQVLKEQPNKRQRLISMLILRAELEIDDGATCLSEQMGYTAAFERHLERRDVSAAKLLPGALCAQHAIIAIGKTAGGRLIVGARDPSPALQAELERATQLTIELAVVPAILVERLVRATFSLAIDLAPVFPAGQASTHRARSVSALFADTQPPKPIEIDPPTVIPGPRPSAPKIVIPERKSGPLAAITDLDSAPILLDRPKRPTGQETPVAVAPQREAETTQQGLPTQPSPAPTPPGPVRVATAQMPRVGQVAPTKPRPPTEPPAPPAARPAVTPVPTTTQSGVAAPMRTTQPGTAVPPRAQPPGPPPSARPPTQPPGPPPSARPPTQPPGPPPSDRSPARPPTQPPGPPPARPPTPPPARPRPPTQPPAPPHSMFDEVTRPAAHPTREEVTVTRLAADPAHNEITRPAVPIDPETGLPPRPADRSTGRQQSPTAPAPNQPVPEDARPPDRRQGPTRPTPNVPIPDEARPPTDEPPAGPPGSIALADLAIEAGATASDPAVKLAPPAAARPAQRPIERPRSVSESFSDLLDEPPMAIAQPLPAAPPPRAATEQPAPRVSAPSLPPPPPAPIRAGSEPAASSAGSAPPKPPPAPGTGSIEAVCKEIERAISRATADRVLISFAGSRFKAALLVMVADDVARGARGQGPRLQAVQTIVLPIEAPSIIQDAHDSRALTRNAPASPTQDRIGELLQSTAPLALPVIVDDAVVAVVVVGDPTETPVTDDDFQKVVLAFATAYKRLYKAK